MKKFWYVISAVVIFGFSLVIGALLYTPIHVSQNANSGVFTEMSNSASSFGIWVMVLATGTVIYGIFAATIHEFYAIGGNSRSRRRRRNR